MLCDAAHWRVAAVFVVVVVCFRCFCFCVRVSFVILVFLWIVVRLRYFMLLEAVRFLFLYSVVRW